MTLAVQAVVFADERLLASRRLEPDNRVVGETVGMLRLWESGGWP